MGKDKVHSMIIVPTSSVLTSMQVERFAACEKGCQCLEEVWRVSSIPNSEVKSCQAMCGVVLHICHSLPISCG